MKAQFFLLATRYSLLATRYSLLATRYSLLATRVPSTSSFIFVLFLVRTPPTTS